MGDVAITAANVAQKGTVVLEQVTYGETVTRGEVVYQKTSDSEFYLADVTTSAETATAKGFVFSAGGDGEKGTIVKSGPLNVGGTLVKGNAYVLSAAGAISPEADLTTSDYITHLGYATTTDTLEVAIKAHGVVI